MSNFVCVFVYLLFMFNLCPQWFVFSDAYYNGHIPCLCTNLDNSLFVSYVFIVLVFNIFLFLKILLDIFLNTFKILHAYFLSLIVTCCCSLFIKSATEI